eukprot:1300120-Alexandrium_andersonii.AAC.1
MSASLVGSEMCIRDRGDARALQGRPPLPPSSLSVVLEAALNDEEWTGGCLLYTSDAADDM